MFCFRSIRELRRWALTNLAAVACALVDFDGSIWTVEVFPDGGVFPLRALSTGGVYS
jgi:hypothetical protein